MSSHVDSEGLFEGAYQQFVVQGYGLIRGVSSKLYDKSKELDKLTPTQLQRFSIFCPLVVVSFVLIAYNSIQMQDFYGSNFQQGRAGRSGNSGGCPKGRLPEEKKFVRA